jgi:2-keto-4-pentenoate hydratase/2-oxohepta-3-ene-1,7-dioic acid hydratase in catechol pathway
VKLVFFESPPQSGPASLGVLTGRGVVPVDAAQAGLTPQETLERLIEAFDERRPHLEALAATGQALPLDQVRLCAPVPWPGKLVYTTAVYGREARAQQQQLLMTLKSAESVIGPGETVRLPDVGEPWQFVPQAALGLVIRGPAKDVAAADWQRAVFGYTCMIDVMARGDQQFGRDFWLAKADTLGPLGPCIVTADEIADPSALRVRSWQSGQPAQDFLISEASHTLGEQIEFATTVLTLRTGDVLACGTAAEGQRPLHEGEQVRVEIEGVGELDVSVARLRQPVGGAR